ncbi:hypothetical protein B0J12DRAFT_649518, partial [Macrophomina phaseolina]
MSICSAGLGLVLMSVSQLANAMILDTATAQAIAPAAARGAYDLEPLTGTSIGVRNSSGRILQLLACGCLAPLYAGWRPAVSLADAVM